MSVYGNAKFRHRLTHLLLAILMIAAALVLTSFLVMHFSPAAMTIALPLIAHAIAGLTPVVFNAILGISAGVFAVSTLALIASGFARRQYGAPENGFAGKTPPKITDAANASSGEVNATTDKKPATVATKSSGGGVFSKTGKLATENAKNVKNVKKVHFVTQTIDYINNSFGMSSTSN